MITSTQIPFLSVSLLLFLFFFVIGFICSDHYLGYIYELTRQQQVFKGPPKLVLDMYPIRPCIFAQSAPPATLCESLIKQNPPQDESMGRLDEHGYETSCPHTFVKERPFDLYDSYHNLVKIDQRGGGQFFYMAKCQNNTGVPACPNCCIGTDTARYTSECKKILGLQAATICLNRWCSKLSRRWVYVDTGCACYYEVRPSHRKNTLNIGSVDEFAQPEDDGVNKGNEGYNDYI